MGLAVYVPARVGEGYFTDWTAPASGSTDTGKVWVWNHTTSKYEPTALGTMATATETNYLLASGSRAGAVSALQPFTSGIVTGIVRPESDSTAAFRVQNAAGSSDVLTVDTTNERVRVDILTSGSNPPSSGAIRLTNDSSINWGVGPGADTIVGFRMNASAEFQMANGAIIAFGGGGAPTVYISSNNGQVAIGDGGNYPSVAKLYVKETSALTDAISNVIVTSHISSGTPAVGFGSGFAVRLQSSTTANQDAGRLIFKWGTSTHAIRASIGQVSSFYTTTEYFPITWGANSSGPMLAFGNVTTPIAIPVLATGGGATADQIITALQALGLVKQS